MDSGWSWVTLLAAFGVHASCGGLQHTAGFIRSILLQNTTPNEQILVTWITSLYSGILNFVGPIASVLVYKYSCRTSVIIGGCLETFGLVLSFFAPNKWFYLITYSFLAAASSGLTYSTLSILLGFNFERHLSVASRVAITGQSVGLMVMPVIINYFYKKYGEQGTFLLLGGVTIQKLVLGALMRPSSLELDQIYECGKTETANDVQCSSNILKGTELAEQKSSEIDKEKPPIQNGVLPVGGNLAYESEMENTKIEMQVSEKTVNIEEKTQNNAASFTEDEINTNSCSSSTQQLPPKHSKTKNKMSNQNDSAYVFSHDNQTEENKMDAEINVRRKIVRSSGEDNLAYEYDETENAKNKTKDAEKTADIYKRGETNDINFISDKNNKISCSRNKQKLFPKTSTKKMSDLNSSTNEISCENRNEENKNDIEINVLGTIARSSGKDNLAYESDETESTESERQYTEKTPHIQEQTQNNGPRSTGNEKHTNNCVYIEQQIHQKDSATKNKMSDLNDSADDIYHANQSNKIDIKVDLRETEKAKNETKDAGKTADIYKQGEKNDLNFISGGNSMNSSSRNKQKLSPKAPTEKMSVLNCFADEIFCENQTEENKMNAEVRGKNDGSSGKDNLAYESDERENTKSEKQDAEKTLNIEEQTQNNDPSFTADDQKPNSCTDSTPQISPKPSTTEIKISDLNDSADEFSRENQTEKNKMDREINARGKIAGCSGKDNLAYESDEKENTQSEKTLNIEEQTPENDPCSAGDEKHTNNCFYIVQQIQPQNITIKNKMSDLNDSADDIYRENQSNKTDIKIAWGFNEAKNIGISKVFRIRKFRFFLLGILFYSIGERTIYMMSPNYFIENGSSQTEVNNLLSILGASSAISQYLMSILACSQLVDTYVLFAVPFGILGIITILLPLYVQSFSGRVTYVIIFGLYNCSVYSLLDQLIVRIAGPDNFSTAFDVVGFTRGLAGIFGPPVSDTIAPFFGPNSNATFVFAGCMYTMCLVTLVLLPDDPDK